MRTTLSIDDDLLVRAKRIAQARGTSLARVMNDIIRMGLEVQISERDGIPVFRVPSSARPVTAEHVEEAEDRW
ncbi:MAG: antitoxin [Myxococcota bacterium]